MALTSEEQIQLLRLQNKALELPAAPAMAPTPTLEEFEKRMKEVLAAHAPVAPALDTLQNAPPPAPVPASTLVPEQPQPNVNWLSKFADVAMAGLSAEQLGRLTKLGMTASAAHGSQGAMQMIAAAVLSFLQTPEGKEYLNLGVDAFLGAIDKATPKSETK